MRQRYLLCIWPLVAITILSLNWLRLEAQPGDALQEVLKEEARRVAAVEKVRPAVVAVFDKGGKGGGSGVLISKEGYALTNFHVVKPAGAIMKCGLANGVFYDGVVVGWDMVGDVALIKLLPKKEGDEFPIAPLGDSDKVQEGDWSLAMGNPFLLATDFTPTVTFGMVSGVHRYQPPEGKGFLEYCDCIQIDASINPGNSGGPLFNMDGELIGINGRGSFDKRGRVNSGVGYAISINQIKHFMGHLKGGLNADHATLGAVVTSQTEKDGYPRMVVSSMIEDSDVARRGLQFEDEIISFDGRAVTSVNHFKNVLGVYPRGWRLPLVFRHKNELKEILVRLMGATAKEIGKDMGGAKPAVQPAPAAGGSPAAKFYQPKKGYVNFYFNKLEKDRVLGGFKKQGDFSKSAGEFTAFGSVKLKQLNTDTPLKIEIKNEKVDGSTNPAVRMTVGNFPFKIEPLNKDSTLQELQQPGGSGGLLTALYLYHRFLTLGEAGMIKCEYAGQFPYYPPLPTGKNPTNWKQTKTLADVIETEFAVYNTKWYFSPQDQKLMAFEVTTRLQKDENEDASPADPCEVYLSDYRQFKGRWLPHQLQIRHGDGTYGTILINNVEFGETK